MPAEPARVAQRPRCLDVLCVLIDDRRLGLPLEQVREVLPAVHASPLPHAPAVVHGLVNLRGQPLPVLGLRVRLGLPSRPLHPEDHVVVCRVGNRDVGVWVDRAEDILPVDPVRTAPVPETVPHQHVSGAVMLHDGLMLVTDIESFLDTSESLQLESALADQASAGTS